MSGWSCRRPQATGEEATQREQSHDREKGSFLTKSLSTRTQLYLKLNFSVT